MARSLCAAVGIEPGHEDVNDLVSRLVNETPVRHGNWKASGAEHGHHGRQSDRRTHSRRGVALRRPPRGRSRSAGSRRLAAVGVDRADRPDHLRGGRAARPAIRRFGLGFIWHETWNAVTDQFGALDFIVATLYVTSLAVLLAAPVSIAIGLYLSELAPGGVRGVVGSLVEMLAAVPSVVLGLWGIFVLGPCGAQPVRPVAARRTRLDAVLRHEADLRQHDVHRRRSCWRS